MVIMTTESAPPKLTGILSRWLIEVQSGVFIGNVTPVIRELLWQRALEMRQNGKVFQAWSERNDQGFVFRVEGDGRRVPLDLEGFYLMANRRGGSSL